MPKYFTRRRRFGTSRFRSSRLGYRPQGRRTGFRRRRFGRGRRNAGGMSWYNRRYNFKDKLDQLLDYSESTAGTGFVSNPYTLLFSTLPTYGVRANMGDQYKIYKWKFVVMPVLPQKQDWFDYRGAWTAGNDIDNDFWQGQHALTIDYNDSSAITNWSQVRGGSNTAVVKNITQPLKVIIRPRIAKMLYETAGTTGYSPGTAWINMSDPSVPHYGIKYSWSIPGFDVGIPAHPRWRYRIIQTIYYGIKNVQRTLP